MYGFLWLDKLIARLFEFVFILAGVSDGRDNEGHEELSMGRAQRGARRFRDVLNF